MLKAIYRIVTLSMALSILVSTLSFTVSMHFCGGKLIDVSIFQKAHSCGTEITSDNDGVMGGCCQDKEVKIEGQDELKLPPVFDANLGLSKLITPSPYQLPVELYQYVSEREPLFFDDPPSFIIKQLFKKNQVYLI